MQLYRSETALRASGQPITIARTLLIFEDIQWLTLRFFVRQTIPFFRSLAFSVFAIIPLLSNAQDRCGTVEYMKNLQGLTFDENRKQFEQWMERRLRTKQPRDVQRQQAIFQVPIVVHVIHAGEPVGVGRNISDAQILSQISVLNKDYQRLNTDATSTPPEFQGVAGSLDIEFVLAKQDPEGFATNGIVRVQGTKQSWSINDNYQLKALSYWPAEDYLNVWVCDLTGILGYSQFPVSGLAGLENSSGNRLTDGIVIAYRAFGSRDEGEFDLLTKYNKGRTTTHEVGHFFGLRHIWGDDEGQCDGTDYVEDTPNQSGNSNGCPSHPQVTCGVTSMYQNFLDYTDDTCMNLFTAGQADRMTAVLENSPRRASLLTSHGLSDPLPASNDMGVRTVISPLSGECADMVVPIIEVRNYGSNTVSSAQIDFSIDGVLIETKDFSFAPALSTLQMTTIDFSSTLFTSGLHTVTFEVTLVNGVPDELSINDVLSQAVLIPENTSLPIVENFDSFPTDWQIINPDAKTTWEPATAPNADPSNIAIKMDFYNYEDNLGEIDLFITPLFDLSTEPVALLLFDVAYARFQNDNDGLKVVVLSNCTADVNQGTVVYEKYGSELQTRSPTSNEFSPTNESQWRTEFIDLSNFAGQSNLQLAFVGINDWGNNLYVDNITLLTTPLNDVALQEVISPRPVICSETVSPKVRIQNGGTLVASVTVRVTVNTQDSFVESFSGLDLLGGTARELELSPITLQPGQNTIFVELLEPNGVPDANPSNNVITLYTEVNTAAEQIPVREDFEDDFRDQWTTINPTGGMNWQEINLGSNTALYVNGYNNDFIGDRSWLVSPVLDFSGTPKASMAFDLSYAFRGNIIDRLQILVSTDCGITYSDTIFNATRTALARGQSSPTAWQPGETQWHAFTFDLTRFAGQQEVRIAFVFTNGNGNNIYLDNIEFYLTDNPLPTDYAFSVHPNPFYRSRESREYQLTVTFYLPVKSPVLIEMIDMTGRVVVSERTGNVLNQTYKFFVPDLPEGTYAVRAVTNDQIFTTRVIILK